jgi:UDP-2-acetamido-3-amino-2,3-dideoxy-glucuronate N-acetyltransferase
MPKFNLQEFKGERGLLQALELGFEIPFEVRRIFTISQVPIEQVRGEHAHKACHQYLWLVEGSLHVEILSSNGSEHLLLNSENRGRHLPPLHWCRLSNFSIGTVLVVLASEQYSKSDYISSLQEFAELVKSA